MGRMSENIGTPISSESESKKKKYYPTTYLSSKEIPGLEDYDIGDTIKLCSMNNVVGKREKENGEIEIEVEIRQCGVMGKGYVPEDDYKDLSDEEKDKMDEKEVMEKN